MNFIPTTALPESTKKLVYVPPSHEKKQKDSENQACYPLSEELLFKQSNTVKPPQQQEVFVTSSVNDQIAPLKTMEQFFAVIPPQIILNIKKLQYISPSAIQQYTIPIAITGSDILATSQTGTGKSAAFLIPSLSQILTENLKKLTKSPQEHKSNYSAVAKPFIIILSPTRELALQNFKASCQFSFKTGILTRVCYGGEGLKEQQIALKRGCDVLIGTPGRLKDYMKQKLIDFSYMKTFILDEADTMINMGFINDIKFIRQEIIEQTYQRSKSQLQTLMFSATFPNSVKQIANAFLNSPYYIRVGDIFSCAKNVKQIILKPQDFKKQLFLKFLLLQKGGALVFCNTKATVAKLTKFLITEIQQKTLRQIPQIQADEFAKITDFDFCETEILPQNVQSLSGDNTQQERNEAIANFSNDALKMLICTDVAQRGIDLPNVQFVVNYEMPDTFEEYQHRIGRTGRAGKAGTAISFVGEFDSKEMLKGVAGNLVRSENEVPAWLQSIFERKRRK
ncbi:ATP-dependent RNA helicase [Spironucleus salmonicida]|uniref:ATP-dependent RNA helicase n=1 Tax=Spironucleus salmonicida TaxID=348837 RepID=V6LW93_9EUKA|nr:ATP-dependent RNA helicase [Spironucleus salmonicida]|eukprot:EST48518.1 ATP-dependent RNA helicase [Spironucleus salmonicida]